MTWSATLKDKQKGEVSWAWVFVFSDGKQTIVKQYTTTSDEDTTIAAMLRAEIAGFDRVNASVGTYKIGDVIDLTLPALQISSPDPALLQFIADKNTLLGLQRQADLRIIAQDDQALLAAYDAIGKSYKSEFAEFI